MLPRLLGFFLTDPSEAKHSIFKPLWVASRAAGGHKEAMRLGKNAITSDMYKIVIVKAEMIPLVLGDMSGCAHTPHIIKDRKISPPAPSHCLLHDLPTSTRRGDPIIYHPALAVLESEGNGAIHHSLRQQAYTMASPGRPVTFPQEDIQTALYGTWSPSGQAPAGAATSSLDTSPLPSSPPDPNFSLLVPTRSLPTAPLLMLFPLFSSPPPPAFF